MSTDHNAYGRKMRGFFDHVKRVVGTTETPNLKGLLTANLRLVIRCDVNVNGVESNWRSRCPRCEGTGDVGHEDYARPNLYAKGYEDDFQCYMCRRQGSFPLVKPMEYMSFLYIWICGKAMEEKYEEIVRVGLSEIRYLEPHKEVLDPWHSQVLAFWAVIVLAMETCKKLGGSVLEMLEALGREAFPLGVKGVERRLKGRINLHLAKEISKLNELSEEEYRAIDECVMRGDRDGCSDEHYTGQYYACVAEEEGESDGDVWQRVVNALTTR